MSDTAPVLVVGATGKVGRLVVDELLARGKKVRALVRPTSDASRLQGAGVEIARGDMLDLASLVEAMDGSDSLITTAAGYTKNSKGDSADTDVIGNRNPIDAASQIGIRRFLLCGILTSDQTPGVPHFWHKKLAEDHLLERGVPFVLLRPGAFFDQFAGSLDKGRLSWFRLPEHAADLHVDARPRVLPGRGRGCAGARGGDRRHRLGPCDRRHGAGRDPRGAARPARAPAAPFRWE